MHTARLHEPIHRGFSDGDVGPFRSLSGRAPFPRSGGANPGGRGPGARFGPRIELELDAGTSAAAEARAAVEVLAGQADAEAMDDVRLLLSEIVTNAVRHSGTPHGAKIGLVVSVARGSIRVEVTDGGDGFEPSPRRAAETDAGGWGLHLVDRIATRWGVDRGRNVRVWFEIDCAA
jgi:anti-sigma regulatory factor (Ser/Thr protein kinase)